MLQKALLATFVLLSGCLFIGCSKKMQKPKKMAASVIRSSDVEKKKLEARLLDVPFFINSHVERVAVSDDERSCMADLIVNVDIVTITDFYMQEMQWEGWQFRASSKLANSAFFYFEKPTRFCSLQFDVISSQKTSLFLVSGQK